MVTGSCLSVRSMSRFGSHLSITCAPPIWIDDGARQWDDTDDGYNRPAYLDRE